MTEHVYPINCLSLTAEQCRLILI